MTAPRPSLVPSPSSLRLLVTLLAVAVVALRKSDSLVNPQFWAEDGAVFFIEAERFGGWGLLFRPYAGYLLFLPRLVAALGTPLPLLYVPAFYAVAALVVTGAIAWWLQSPRLGLPGGAVAAVALAVLPHTGEVYLTTSNLQWIAALGLFALVLAADATALATRVGEVFLLVAVGLTGPFVILALPLFTWRLCVRRTVWSAVLLGGAVVCAAAHIPSLLARTPAEVAVAWSPMHHAAVAGRRVVVTLFAGQTPLPALACALAGIAAFLSLAVVLWRRRARLPGGLVLLAAAALVLAATGYKERPDTWTLSELVNGDRYFFIPKVILVWLVAAVAITSAPRLRLGLFALLLMPLFANVPRFFFPPAPDQNWAASCALIARGQPVWVQILPPGTNILHPGRPSKTP